LHVGPAFARATPNSSPTTGTSEIIEQENAFWDLYRNGDTDGLEQLMLPNYTNVEQTIWSRDQVFNFLKQFHAHCTLGKVKLLDPKVEFLTSDIATIVYHATETATCGPRIMSGNTNISTVWVRRDGRWLMHLHTEYAELPN